MSAKGTRQKIKFFDLNSRLQTLEEMQRDKSGEKWEDSSRGHRTLPVILYRTYLFKKCNRVELKDGLSS